MATIDCSEFLNQASSFLWNHSWIFKEANTKFVEANVLDHIPQSWVDALKELTEEEFNGFPFGISSSNLPKELEDILGEATKLKGFYEVVEPSVSQVLPRMSPKKSHEIIKLGELINSFCKPGALLIDLGCGLGYLSEYLQEKYGYEVLGIESDEVKVKSARERQKKYHPQSRVKYVAHFITESSLDFIQQQIQTHFPGQHTDTKLVLVGLHACGDLTITALRLATADSDNVKGLVIMPCCYHRMELINESEFRNFPLSNALKSIIGMLNGSPGHESNLHVDQLSMPFNRPFLRLACQQNAKHWQRMSAGEHKLHGLHMFRRALVGAITGIGDAIRPKPRLQLADGETNSAELTFDSICDNFTVFRGTVQVPWSEEQRALHNQLSKKYEPGWLYAEILTGLQVSIQEICEQLVLLDKVQYVNELKMKGVSCRLKKITDASLSPRCFALVINC